MADAPDNNQTTTPPPERSRVAEIVTGFALGGVTLLSAIVLYFDHSPDTMKYVFAAVLPLLGSWMGTILAFYFSRDNLAAATQSVKEMTKVLTGTEKLKAVLAQDAMRPLKDIKFEEVDAADDDKKKLSDLMQKGVERIPILNKQSVIRYLIYKSMIDKYLAKFAGKDKAELSPPGTVTPVTKAVADLTLLDMVSSDAAMKKLFEGSFAFVAVDATLADAKREMDKIDKCADVFVTATGKKEEPIVGWITDNAIIENLKV